MRKVFASAVGSLLICGLVGCAPKNLLLVTEYGDGSPRVSEMSDAINARMKAENAPYILRVYNTNLTGRVSSVWRTEVSRTAVVRVNAAEPAVTFVAGDDAACYFAQKIIDTQRPFIFLDLYGLPSDYKLTASPLSDVTGVVPVLPVREEFALMKQLVPSARAVAVLSDESLAGDAIVQDVQSVADLPLQVTIVKRADTLADWLAAVKDLQTKADVLLIASCREVRKDAQSEDTVPLADILQATSEANRLPDFSFSKDTVGPHGVLGAVTVPLADQARIATGMVVDALYHGKELRDMPVVRCTSTQTILSADRAAELGVSVTGVPPVAKPAQPEAAPAEQPSAKPAMEPAAKPEVTPPAEPAVTPPPAEPAPSASAPAKYKVKAGDTLGSIAKKFYGDARKWKVIYDANRDALGANPDRLKAKMELVIPAIGAAQPAPAKAAPAPAEAK